MLNVLSAEAKKQLRAARFNVVMRNYYILLIATALLLGGVFAAGLYLTGLQKTSADATKAAAQQEAQKYSATSQAADKFSKDLAIDKTILASDVRFSTLITDIAAVVPNCVVLSNLTIGATSTTTPLALSGRACAYDDAVRLKNSLENSPLFEDVKLVNAATSDASAQTDTLGKKYPVTVSVSAQFSKTTGGKK